MKYTLIICLALAAIWFRSTDKETPDWTGTTQGEYVFDSIEDQREMDSIDDYMRHWYEVLDTNSDGDIDE
jgi:aminoglycoside N3'-acetyltransferase